MKILALLAACLLAGCAANAPLRDDSESTCADMRPCSDSYYERHPNYEIGFVEYSERGNDFAPARTQRLIDQLKRYSARGDSAMVVFIHGWKHNAGRDDGNVASFNKALANLASSGVLGKRRLVGLYVGWRGKSMHGPQLRRRNHPRRTSRPVARTPAGSPGRSADTRLRRRGNHAESGDRGQSGPAAQENSLKVGALGTQPPPLLYVISSHGDSATHFAFPLGQWVGVNLTWSQVDLDRTYNGTRYRLREEDLDTTALGNYSLYRTALLIDRECPLPAGRDNCAPRPPEPRVIDDTDIGKWRFRSFCSADGGNADPALPRMPCYSNEPVNFIYTSQSFIADHNDIFNDQVIAFMATAVSKAIYERTAGASYYRECHDPVRKNFSFGKCFDFHYLKATAMHRRLQRQLSEPGTRSEQDVLYENPL
ncbi:hypothetical protein I5F81_01665 [Pseudomonas aeruginosa]|nr:hypothetical protein [Pseudomonas aeruginosa]